jgi:dATP pyrophosphohydrolase
LNRSDSNYWQFIAGGAEVNETPLEAAKREANEEAGIPLDSKIISLDSMCCVPANIFRDWRQWPKGTYVLKEFAFAVEVISGPITLRPKATRNPNKLFGRPTPFIWQSRC